MQIQLGMREQTNLLFVGTQWHKWDLAFPIPWYLFEKGTPEGCGWGRVGGWVGGGWLRDSMWPIYRIWRVGIEGSFVVVIKKNSQSKFTENYFLNKRISKKEQNPTNTKSKIKQTNKNVQTLGNVILQLNFALPQIGRICEDVMEEKGQWQCPRWPSKENNNNHSMCMLWC